MNLMRRMSKIFVVCFGMLVVLMVGLSSAYANNVEVTKNFFSDLEKRKTSFRSFTDSSTRQTVYEDDKVIIEVAPLVDKYVYVIYGGARSTFNKAYDNVLMCVHQTPLWGEIIYINPSGVQVNVQNKTSEVIVWDLNKSSISIGSYIGRPVPANTKFSESGSAVFPPVIIPPRGKITNNVFRGDFYYVPKVGNGESHWKHPIDPIINVNLFGTGDLVFNFNQSGKEVYIAMKAYVFVPESSFDSYLKNKKK